MTIQKIDQRISCISIRQYTSKRQCRPVLCFLDSTLTELWAMCLGVTERVQQDEAFPRAELAGLADPGQGLQHPLGQGGVGVPGAVLHTQQLPQLVVHAEQLVVRLEAGRLGQLGGEGVNPVPHPAGHGVLQLAEVVAAQSY